MSHKYSKKTIPERIIQIHNLCFSHFGDIRSVGIQYHDKIGWIAKAHFNDEFEDLTAEGKNISHALGNLKRRIKKIIKRYNEV